jgi:hypothetical protein
MPLGRDTDRQGSPRASRFKGFFAELEKDPQFDGPNGGMVQTGRDLKNIWKGTYEAPDAKLSSDGGK